MYSADGNPTLQFIRRTWWRFFNNFLMYTEKDVEILKSKKFDSKNLIAINNGLNQNEIDTIRQKWNETLLDEFKEKHAIHSQNIVISSGRINKVNNHLLALEAIVEVKKTFPDVLWVIIGGGTEVTSLQILVQEKNMEKNVLFLGEIYEEEQKCPWFLISKVLIHPGYMGLTIFNSFGYSLPIITHDNIRNHSPEVFLFEEDKTGFLFKENDVEDLVEKINFALKNTAILDSMKNYCYDIVRYKNNTDIMSKQFLKMINSLK